jgi:hypothetical protein
MQAKAKKEGGFSSAARVRSINKPSRKEIRRRSGGGQGTRAYEVIRRSLTAVYRGGCAGTRLPSFRGFGFLWVSRLQCEPCVAKGRQLPLGK